jgi:hypothetical protein
MLKINDLIEYIIKDIKVTHDGYILTCVSVTENQTINAEFSVSQVDVTDPFVKIDLKLC